MKKLLHIPIYLLVLLIAIPGFAKIHVVAVQDFTFQPSAITGVSVGDTIHWKWINGSHTTTSTVVPAGASSWNHPINSTSQTFDYIVTVPGDYNFQCAIHFGMGMVGSFTAVMDQPLSVLPANQPVTSNSGNTSFVVTSGSSWTASVDSAWCTITQSGTGNGTIFVQYTGNPLITPRIATITVNSAGLTPQTITVTQDGTNVGVNTQWQGSFQIYPNPTSGMVTVVPGGTFTAPVQVSIMDITGKTIVSELSRSTDQFHYDLSSFPGGIYFVKIRSVSGEDYKLAKLIVK